MKKVAGIFALLLVAGTAQAKVLKCTTGEDSWVNSPYVFGYEADTKTATIYDPVIHKFVGEPITGEYQETAKKIVFTWSVLIEVRGDQTKMTYRASYFPANGKFTVRATPGAGYTSNFEGRGTCTVKEN